MKAIKYFILTILTSLYIFPIEFVFLPSINSKMMLAVLGVVTFLIRLATGQQDGLSKDMVKVGTLAVVVSLCGLISVSWNNTNDFTYATYFVSFLVWSFAAYFVICMAKVLLGGVNVNSVCNILICLAIAQCCLALVIDSVPSIKDAVNNVVVGFGSMYSAGEGLEKAGRLYGIGAALDVAGTRFSAIISFSAIMAYNCHQKGEKGYEVIYIVAFFFILVIGSIISRTTGLGALFAILFLLIESRGNILSKNSLFIPIGIILLFAVLLLIRISPVFEGYMRFAFEGVFNLIEKGEWNISSNETLKTMYVFPEHVRTWLIGDGYFNEPSLVDPNYVGEISNYGIFYMGTDVGYLRFLFYFGSIGLIAFISYFLFSTSVLLKRFPENKWVIYALLFMGLTIWFKVATDIYCFFALFLCIRREYDFDTEIYDADVIEKVGETIQTKQ